MATRSTRNKIRFQADKMLCHCARIQENLKYMDDLANGGSAYITREMPMLVNVTEMLEGVFKRFREGL